MSNDKMMAALEGAKCWCGGRIVAPAWGEPGEVKCFDSKFHDPLADGRPREIKKIYIAGPMSGYPECNYPAFHVAEASLRMRGYDAVNPANSDLQGAHYVDFLREDLRWMLDCDAVAVLDRWWESAGARNEVQVAGLLRMPVRSVREWIALKDFQ